MLKDVKRIAQKQIQNFKSTWKQNGWFTSIENTIGVIDSMSRFRNEPNIYNGMNFGLRAAKLFTKDYLPYYDDFVEDYGYISNVCDNKIVPIIVDCLKHEEYDVIKTNAANSFLIKLRKYPVCWYSIRDKKESVSSLACDPTQYEEVFGYIRELIWQKYENKNLVVHCDNTTNKSEGAWNIEEDMSIDAKPSPAATTLANEVREYGKHNIPRSIMLWGRPGTGKSTAVREICQLLKYRYIRFRVEELHSFSVDAFEQLIDLLHPECVVIDDFDRVHMQAQLLETLEMMHHKGVKCFLATVNDLDKLESALIRPGRFDEILEFNKLGDEAVHTILQTSGADDAFELVKEWPVAYIQEYCLRRKIFGKEKAEKDIVVLDKRVQEASRGQSDSIKGLKKGGNSRASILFDRDDEQDDDDPFELDDDISSIPKK